MATKVRDLMQDSATGWLNSGSKGDHRQFKHPSKLGIVTVHGHPSDDVPPGTLDNILKQAKLGEQ